MLTATQSKNHNAGSIDGYGSSTSMTSFTDRPHHGRPYGQYNKVSFHCYILYSGRPCRTPSAVAGVIRVFFGRDGISSTAFSSPLNPLSRRAHGSHAESQPQLASLPEVDSLLLAVHHRR
ncbi:hypothetical protein VTN96DRAFT_7492 [Rasamsonia emersonii]